MADKKDDKPRVMPKGGRKGGTTFPRMGLTEALTYSDNVAKKTTTVPQIVENIDLRLRKKRPSRWCEGRSAQAVRTTRREERHV